MTRTGFATTDDGVRLYTETTGEGEDVVFVHEFAGDCTSWEPQVRHFARRYRCTTYNARGWPPSDVPPDVAAYSQQRAVADLVAVMDALGIAKAHVVGNSMGGALAIDFALAHPERVASIVVEASGPNGFPVADDRAKYQSDLAAITSAFQGGAATWKQQPMVVVAHADPRVAPLLHRMIDDNARIFAMQYWPDDDKSAVGRLGELRVPALFVVGDRDIALVRDAAAFAAAHIAGARIETIRGTDHLAHMEEPAAFAALVRPFIAAHATAKH